MTQLALKIIRKDGSTAGVARDINEVRLVSSLEYAPGDRIVLESSEAGVYLVCQLDDALGSSLIYLKGKSLAFYIPFAEKKIAYSPKAFSGSKHYLFARLASDEEIGSYRNLAYNPIDHHDNTTYFPHAKANVETRGEAVFAARNAIDGIRENSSHGEWPYASWGINRDKNARFHLDFGRKVVINKIIIVERADFPHDNWWQQISISFSDGSQMDCKLIKTGAGQEITFEDKEVDYIELHDLIQSEEASPFPALTQIEVYGVEAKGKKEKTQ